MTSSELVEAFWEQVWNAHDPEAVDRFVVEDFVITNGGRDIVGRDAFKAWVAAFLAELPDLRMHVEETFENADGSRVTSRWRITGTNYGYLHSAAIGEPIGFTGTAVWEVRDGSLVRNWVERSTPAVLTT
ncbi:SnoaL-like polyketide cyclase [Kribbella orskensis]|uniref:SnoaL-like polyketide cyclase n=1 Tax=Kribbella orskensis TaxID=2512216 RepID=A0ABY2BTP5_9ACTN|nr:MULTISPECIES: nuclear transport factor 2 family protein [Kribbella]TCN42663.1 SnoaL-like polyketide cyclase [Kribbella sp. VKM Ac-2500]TCO29981.1 SnoaL-like polyketide cyclase [Kribbella orskensis]